MISTGERRYDNSCNQPYIIFGAGTRIVQNSTCASHCGIGSDIGEAAETSSESVMLRLHLPRASYDLFVYNFPYCFQAS